jgi:hypothetical protein
MDADASGIGGPACTKAGCDKAALRAIGQTVAICQALASAGSSPRCTLLTGSKRTDSNDTNRQLRMPRLLHC